MSIFGGFDPGTWQAWSLNLLSQVFVKAGIARGFQVTQTATPSMAVLVNLDPTWSDGVLYLANGAFMRIDAQTQYTISSNSSGLTRTDALIAQVDPTNANNTSLSVQANWSGGFTPANNNQFIVALISVANNATSILNANITMNSAVATITGTNISGNNTIIASDGDGLSLQDNSATSTMTLVMTGLTAGVGRNLAIQTTDVSAIGHLFTFDTTASFTAPNNIFWGGNGVAGRGGMLAADQGGSIELGANAIVGAPLVKQTPYIDFHTFTAAVDYDVRITASGGNGTVGQGSLAINGTGGVTYNGPLFVQPVGQGNSWLWLLNVAPTGSPTVNNNWILVFDGSTGDLLIQDNSHGRTVLRALASNGLLKGINGSLAQLLGTGATAGNTVYEGPTDPGAGAGEGDLWVAG